MAFGTALLVFSRLRANAAQLGSLGSWNLVGSTSGRETRVS